MKHGTLVAALIVTSTPVSRASVVEPAQPVHAASVKNGAVAELAKKLFSCSSLSEFCFISAKFAMPVGLAPRFKHV